MTSQQKLFAIAVSLALVVFVFELVRRRRLRVEYAWLWLATAAGILTLVVRYDWLEAITHAIGAVLPTTTLFIFALLFLIVTGIHFSTRVTLLVTQQKNLAQEVALLRFELERRDALLADGAAGESVGEKPGEKTSEKAGAVMGEKTGENTGEKTGEKTVTNETHLTSGR